MGMHLLLHIVHPPLDISKENVAVAQSTISLDRSAELFSQIVDVAEYDPPVVKTRAVPKNKILLMRSEEFNLEQSGEHLVCDASEFGKVELPEHSSAMNIATMKLLQDLPPNTQVVLEKC